MFASAALFWCGGMMTLVWPVDFVLYEPIAGETHWFGYSYLGGTLVDTRSYWCEMEPMG